MESAVQKAFIEKDLAKKLRTNNGNWLGEQILPAADLFYADGYEVRPNSRGLV